MSRERSRAASIDSQKAGEIEIRAGIRDLRVRRGLTQQQLALRAGLTVSFIAQLETDRCGVSMKNVHALAKALDIPSSWIILLAPQGNQCDKKVEEILQKIQGRIRKNVRQVPLPRIQIEC